ncbi:DUF6497 family protein [Frigidibacter sp. MR17.24]|uniref:DUF6497 family protein n=1 Tax=Frigidibacter sp. MR17.24 TaxID=3127345 RepID=UPI003012D1A4
MIRLAALLLLPAPALAAPIVTPSGLAVEWVETLQDAHGPEGLTARFRFLAPGIAGGEAAGLDLDAVSADMQWLCDSFALPRIATTGPQPRQIVISLADREMPFGETDPEATQFFEAYQPGEGACEWEMF